MSQVQWGGKYYVRALLSSQESQPVPYESGIAGEGLSAGKKLVIQGIPDKKAKAFHINLLKKNGDIALHFNPRFTEKVSPSFPSCSSFSESLRFFTSHQRAVGADVWQRRATLGDG